VIQEIAAMEASDSTGTAASVQLAKGRHAMKQKALNDEDGAPVVGDDGHAKKLRLVDHATIAAFGFRANGYKSLLDRRDVPDYAVDKHTRRGRQLGRGYKHFFQEGAHLENRADIPDPYESRAGTALEKS
jgi:hypothetical protein